MGLLQNTVFCVYFAEAFLERVAKELNRRGMYVLLICGAVCLAFGGCSKKKPKTEDVTKYEHQILDPPSLSGTPTPGQEDPKKDPTPTPTPEPEVTVVDGQKFTPVNDEVYVSASKLNLRKGPSTSYDSVILAKSGDTFTRTATGDGGWDQLLYQGETVYAFAEYIKPVSGKGGNPTAGGGSMSGLSIVNVTQQKYTYEKMCEDLQALNQAYPGKLTINKLTMTKDGRNVYDVVLGNPSSGKNIIIQSSIHAREYMTTQLIMKLIEYYLANEKTESYEGVTYAELLETVAFHILPMVNPDGVTISQSGAAGVNSTLTRTTLREWYDRDLENGVTKASFEEYLKRFKANANGVDLNRNFDYGWNEFQGSSVPGAEKYKGISPGSEPETAALISLTEQLKPVAAISYHASGSVLYWDYGQTGALRDTCLKLADLLHSVTGYERKDAATDPQDAAGYGDWAVMVKQIPSVTIEIGTGTAPLASSEFEAIFQKNTQVLAALAKNYR